MKGKLGIIRLKGKPMTELRKRVFKRSNGRCEFREVLLAEIRQKIESKEITWEHGAKAAAHVSSKCWRQIDFENMHLAHILNKRNNGDTEENTLASCRNCHTSGDHNFYGSPCPPKPTVTQ